MSTPSSTMASLGKSSIASGPYKATQLWNDVLQAFKTNVPVGKRRRHIKTYDKCFVASESINWLLFYLQSSPNFGPHVTRDNAVQLLQKFHKLGIFEDVRGTKYNKEQFDDGSRLFRFVPSSSPTKSEPSPAKDKEAKSAERTRPPLSSRTVLMNTDRKAHTLPPSMEKVKLEGASNQALSQCHLVARRTISPLEIEDLWKTVTLSRLKNILQAELIEDVFATDCVNPRHIIHNVTHINRNGVVTNLDRKDHVPPWVLSIMKCLAHWPEETEEGLPNYPNFERDMFKTVETYYKALGESLVCTNLYEAFTSAYIAAKYRSRDAYPNHLGSSPASVHSHHEECHYPSDEQDSIRAFASMENLMLNLTMQGGMLEEDGEYYHPAARGSCYNSRENMLSKSQNRVNRDYASSHNGHLNEATVNGYAYSQQQQQRHYDQQQSNGFNRRGSQRHPSSSQADVVNTGHGGGVRGGVGVARRPTCRSQSNLHGRSDFEGQERPQPVDGNTSDYCSNDGSSGSYNHQRNPPGRQAKQGASSVWSVYSQFQAEDEEDDDDDDANIGSQKCLSLADLATVQPGPENDLARSERVKSWVNMQAEEQGQPTEYAPPTRPSTTPKPLRARKNQQARTRSYSNREIEQDHAYSYQPHEEPWYAESEKVTKKKRLARSRSEVGGGMLGRPAPPPPYVPPPSYKSSLVSSGATPRAYNAVYAQSGHPNHSVWHGSNHSSTPKRNEPQQKQMSKSSRVNLQESYRMAMYANDTAMTPPVPPRTTSCQPLYRNLHLAVTSPNVSSPEVIAQVSEALRLLCLFLPPGNRRKLHLLLRLMWRMEDNYHLVLDPHVSNRHLLLTTFTSCILRPSDNASTAASDDLARSIVEFMVDNHQQIFSVPLDLKDEVENQLTLMKQVRCVPSWDESPTSITYCQQVTPQEYEQQRLSNSQMELRNLLDAIVADDKLSPRKKKKKIKHFQKAHPDIYAKRFPSKEPEKESHGGKPKIKQPLLSKPLQKFKSIRL